MTEFSAYEYLYRVGLDLCGDVREAVLSKQVST